VTAQAVSGPVAAGSLDGALEIETLEHCPLCASRDLGSRFEARDRLWGRSDTPFAYARCGSCGVWFQCRRPTERSLAAHYPSDYEPYQAESARGTSPVGAALALPARVVNALTRVVLPDGWRRASKRAYALPRPGARMLDFGCGSARALDAARRRGWSTIGADFVPAAVAAARAGGHAAYLAGEELWGAVPDDSLDLVRLNHVVEHLYDPRAVLTRLRAKLAPGGTLHLATPNARSAAFRVFRSRWWGLECPRHAILYDAGTLRALLERAGFTRVEVWNETTAKDFLRSATYVLIDLGWARREALATAASSVFWNEVLHVPARCAALCGVSSRLQVLAGAP